MFRLGLGLWLLYASFASAEEFSALSQKDCQASFDSIAAIEGSIMPLTFFQLTMLEEHGLTGGATMRDRASEIIGHIEAAYALISDLCTPSDFESFVRPSIDRNSITAENCEFEIAALRPDLVRPLSAFDDIYSRVYLAGFETAAKQVLTVKYEANEVVRFYNHEYGLAVRVCRFVRTLE